MSTKTTFKRIALVTVAVLGFGTLSVAPSSAAVAFNALYHASAAGDCNAGAGWACTTRADEQSFVAINKQADYGYQHTFSAGVAGDTASATWTLTSSPVGFLTPLISTRFWKDGDVNGPAYVEPGDGGGGGGVGGWFLAGTGNPTVGAAVLNGTSRTAGDVVIASGGALNSLTSITKATAAGATVGNYQSSFTPTVAGTYVWTLTAGSVSYKWTVNAYATQAAADAARLGVSLTPSATTSTSSLGAGNVAPADGAPDVAVAASRALAVGAGNAAATIKVVVKNSAGTTITANTTLSATISGPGLLSIGSAVGQAATGIAVAGGVGQNLIQVYANGTAGAAVITISAGSTQLATESVVFYGSPTKIVATVAKPIVTVVGATAGTVTGIVTDANGNPVAGANVKVVSSNTAALSDAYTACAAASDATGAVSCPVTGVAAGVANITLTTNTSAADTSGVTSNSGSVRFGSATAAKYVMTLDKASYEPGELATVSIAMTDASGLPVADSAVIGGALTTTRALAVNNFNAAGTPAAASTTGVYSFKVNMPLSAGNTTLTFTNGLLTSSVTAEVTGGIVGDVAQAAQDAAAEATDAANAATDAANAAAEAADAATAAAQDAADAVAALSVQVSEQIAALQAQNEALRKQLVALTNLIIKIQKKVKA